MAVRGRVAPPRASAAPVGALSAFIPDLATPEPLGGAEQALAAGRLAEARGPTHVSR